MLVRKNARKVRAWCLGGGSEMEQTLVRRGLLVRESGNIWRMFSQETDTVGQAVRNGDWFKVDGAGAPYPNEREFFLANHRHLWGDWFVQTSPVLFAWRVGEPPCRELAFVVQSGQLRVDPDSDSHYYTAYLWGAWLHAARDAVVIFDRVQREGEHITAAEFHFITAEEFDRTYTRV